MGQDATQPIKRLGDWAAGGPYALATNYQAAADGFVCVYDSDSDNTIDGYTDVNAAPAQIRVKSFGGTTKGAGFTMPVRKGDYWRLDSVTAISAIFWIPWEPA